MYIANRRVTRHRNRLAVAVSAAALVLLVTACDGKDDLAAAGPTGEPTASAPSAPASGAAAPSGGAGSGQAADDPSGAVTPSTRVTAPPSSAPSADRAPAGAPSPHPTFFIKPTERYPMPNGAYITVNDVQTLETPDGLEAPAGSNRVYVAVEIRNEGTRPLPLEGKVHVTIKRYDNGRTMKQVDWLPGEGGAADFFAMTLQPGEHFDAPLGFRLEQSGYAKGFAIYVTLDQPGSPAYPAKFLYAPPMG
ncbi:hypothetical protein ACFWVC_36810 [Streptomyces sp. NPDC058691]|uniref:hypothetical protein n=1 Tax=Streptomyces sp. NPDC058691 TaxID=3346601 RepID=UPI003651EB95